VIQPAEITINKEIIKPAGNAFNPNTLKNAFDPTQNGFINGFDPTRNGFINAFDPMNNGLSNLVLNDPNINKIVRLHHLIG
jgi:hypothetical protein